MARPSRSHREPFGIFRLIGRLMLFSLAGLGLLVVSLTAVGVWLVAQHGGAEPAAAERVVVTADLNRGLNEAPSLSPFGQIRSTGPYVLRDLLDALDKAAADPKVSALVVRLNAPDLTMARVQELRDAVGRFRASGKPAVLFSESLGNTQAYYLASSFGEIWLQPSGDVGLTGFAVESPFLRGTLEELEIEAQFGARHEYKSAIETFTQRGFSQEARESLMAVLRQWSDQVVADVAQARGLTPDQVRWAMNRGPLLPDEALEARLVDKLGYWDEVQTAFGLQESGKTALVDLRSYLKTGDRPNSKGTGVALIYGVGTVQTEEPDYSPFGGSQVMASDTVAKAIRDAVADDAVKAIVLRIDSPGGSYTASDTIWRAVRQARQAGKPVVASMGHMAASGGYFAAMGADVIVADPTTITGSIGVFAGKLVLREFWRKLGIEWDEVHIGDNALVWSANQPFSAEGWALLNRHLDRIYQDFTAKAGEARKLDAAAMDRVARGRIWSGVDAKAHGLVDELGGYRTALAATRRLLELPEDAPLKVQVLPKRKGALAELFEAMDDGELPLADAVTALVRIGRATEALEPVLRQVEARDGALKDPLMEGLR